MNTSDFCIIHSIDGTPHDITHLLIDAQLSGRNNSPSRSLQLTLVDLRNEENKKEGRADINPIRGDQVIFLYKGEELFRGLWMKTQRSDSQEQKATAYDMGIYLSNNKDTFCYESPMSASDVFSDICSRFGIPKGSTANTGYKISDIAKSKTTAWDVLCKLLEETYNATGKRFAVYAEKGKLNLVERENNVRQWVIETGVNLQSYDKSLSTEKVRTRVKVYSKEDTVIAEAVASDLESKIGRMQDIESATDDDLEQGKAQEIANGALKNLTTPDEAMSVEATGIPEVITGTCIYVRIKNLEEFEKVCYVDEDTHKWDKGGGYTMKLKIRPAE